MSAPTNHWKLGFFVVVAALVGLAAAVVITARAVQLVSVSYTSYFDEAVTGLELGSPVRFRGVPLGNVSAIEVAPDRRHVEVTYSLGVKVLERLGLASGAKDQETKLSVPPDLRVQIGTTGLTGTKFLQLDFFDAKGTPLPVLPFPVPANHIPATASMMKNLEDSVVRAVDQLPVLAQELGSVVARMNLILEDVHGRRLPGKAVATLEGADRLVASMQRKLDQLPVDQLSGQLSTTLVRLDKVLQRLDGDDGVLASAQRATDSVGDLAGPQLGGSLEAALRDLREGAVAVRQLVDALQRDPDMLLKGKAEVSR